MTKSRSRWQIFQSLLIDELSNERFIVGFTLALWLLAGGLFLRTFQHTTLNCQRIEPKLIDCDWYSSWDSVRGVTSQSLKKLLTTTIDSFEVPAGDDDSYIVYQLVLIGRGGQVIEIPAMRSRPTAHKHAETINQFIENETQSELQLTIRPYLNPVNLFLAFLPVLWGLGTTALIVKGFRQVLRRETERLNRESFAQDVAK